MDLPDRYIVQSRLGEGTMGLVLRVYDTLLERDVAMKVCKEPVNAHRFLREARSTARLEHPNIVPVYDIGWLPDLRPYYTMRIAQVTRLDSELPHVGASDRPIALRQLARWPRPSPMRTAWG